MTNDIEGLRKVAEEATKGPWERVRQAQSLKVSAKGQGRIAVGPGRPYADLTVCLTVARYSPLGTAINEANVAYITTFDPPTVLALLSELEAVKEERDEALKLMSEYARKAGEATGRLEMSEAAGIVDGWRERAEAAEAALVSLKGGGGSSRTETASGAPSAALASETQRKSEWKVGDRARVVADNEYSDGAEDIGAEFTVEGLREGSRGRTVLLTGNATRGFDGFYAERCERVADE